MRYAVAPAGMIARPVSFRTIGNIVADTWKFL